MPVFLTINHRREQPDILLDPVLVHQVHHLLSPCRVAVVGTCLWDKESESAALSACAQRLVQNLAHAACSIQQLSLLPASDLQDHVVETNVMEAPGQSMEKSNGCCALLVQLAAVHENTLVDPAQPVAERHR